VSRSELLPTIETGSSWPSRHSQHQHDASCLVERRVVVGYSSGLPFLISRLRCRLIGGVRSRCLLARSCSRAQSLAYQRRSREVVAGLPQSHEHLCCPSAHRLIRSASASESLVFVLLALLCEARSVGVRVQASIPINDHTRHNVRLSTPPCCFYLGSSTPSLPAEPTRPRKRQCPSVRRP
jgi:hypothetical protein